MNFLGGGEVSIIWTILIGIIQLIGRGYIEVISNPMNIYNIFHTKDMFWVMCLGVFFPHFMVSICNGVLHNTEV